MLTCMMSNRREFAKRASQSDAMRAPTLIAKTAGKDFAEVTQRDVAVHRQPIGGSKRANTIDRLSRQRRNATYSFGNEAPASS